MADQPNTGAEAARALGGMMEGESPPFPTDEHTTDQASEIADIFGLGEEAGPVPNSSESSSGGGASPSGATPAAEGGEGQAQQPATPPVQQPQPGQQGEQPQAPAQQPQAPAAPAAPPAAPAQPAGEDPRIAALTAQIQALTTLVGQLQAGPQPQGAGQQTPQTGPDGSGQPQADPNMDYRLAIPDDVANAIFNEDAGVARQGMQHLINSFGRIVHERVLRSVDQLVEQRLAQYGQQSALSQQQEQMRNEYFQAFPQHNEPGIRIIVAQEAQAMWTQNPTLQWDGNARNALGARVAARLGQTQTPPQQPQQGAIPPAPAPAPAPAAQMGASTRPQANPADNDGTFITDILSAG